MNQENLSSSLIQKQIMNDKKEVMSQLNKLQDGLHKMKTIYSGTHKVIDEQSNFIAENKRFLEEKVDPKIQILTRELQLYETKVNQMMDVQLQLADIKYYYQEFDTKMQEFYDFYKVIWAQVHYYVERRRILLNQDPEKKQQLVQKLLQ
ncbi:unnamed protein product (macronuclear) [Paramecium tetraurelia]|uniref:Uncharacterized protein n=1 Tax=Paramecium tetraurelia TaxID=5888 RepID=A0BUN4_PARTE|nr:uncharacterized protein GSPATT00005497001 [Paramecium tetraurelia]CAK62251.1 unnamed protein product [Paramecium tetraurelia]|eukprot:XP_001429649.1 hypothetical protein (macronuclear) [Paramecium tetraurelia strain d4-2]